MQGWNDQQQPHQHGKSDGGIVQVPWLPQDVEFLGLAGTGTLSMWSGNNKKSHFSSRCTIQSNWDISLFSSSWLYFCISMKSRVCSSLWKVKSKSQRDLLSHRHFTCLVRKHRVQLSSKLPAKHWSRRRMKPSTGSHLPPEAVKDTHSCWLHCLTAAMPDSFTTPGSSE